MMSEPLGSDSIQERNPLLEERLMLTRSIDALMKSRDNAIGEALTIDTQLIQ